MLPRYFELLQEHRLANMLSERTRHSSGLRRRLKSDCIILPVAKLCAYFQFSTKSPVKKVSRFSKDSTCKIFRTVLTLEAASLTFLHPLQRDDIRWPDIHSGFMEIGRLFQELLGKGVDNVWGYLYNELYLD
jgi:hypothetical protein